MNYLLTFFNYKKKSLPIIIYLINNSYRINKSYRIKKNIINKKNLLKYV